MARKCPKCDSENIDDAKDKCKDCGHNMPGSGTGRRY